jgi:hypothetical protein
VPIARVRAGLEITRAWLALDLRRRRRPLVVLSLLIAVATGTVLAAVAGARRGESAMTRLAAGSAETTAMVAPNEPGFDWDRIRALPEVERVGTLVLGLNLPLEGIEEAPIEYVPGDEDLERTIERPAVLAGRLPRADRADEAMVQPEFVARHHVGLGDTVTARLYTAAQIAAAARGEETGAAAGPRLPIRIVGVGRTVLGELLDVDRPQLYPSPALYRQYRSAFVVPGGAFVNALVRLRGGEVDLPAFQADLERITGRSDINVRNVPELMRRAQRSFTFQARCLLAFATAAFLASLVLVGQAVARYAAIGVEDLQVLRTLGMTPRQAVVTAAVGPVLTGVAGATVGVLAAAVASSWFPIGSAARMEPVPGVDLDGLVLAAGWVGVVVLVGAGALAAARRALLAEHAAPGRRSAVAAAVAWAGLPVPVLVGTRFALEPGRGRTAAPVRPALLGAVAGVLGVVGAFTFSAGVWDAGRRPERFGQTWGLEVFTGFNGQVLVPEHRRLLAAAARDPDVSGVDDARIGVAEAAGQGTSLALYTDDAVGAPIPIVLLAGRRPGSDDEIVLAPSSASRLDAAPGSRVAVTGGEGRHRDLAVVGIGFVPVGPHNDYDAGGWVRAGTFDALFGSGFTFRTGLVALAPGARPEAVAARLDRLAAAAGLAGVTFTPPEPPAALTELRQVGVLPLALGYFLVVLALGAVGHALATTQRRRRLDVAVLRALGLTRWQSRGLVVTQASVLALVGLACGVPLGVALGRTLWRVVADYTPLAYSPPLAAVALLLVAPCALLVANLLAAWPGHQAARLRVASVLRAE